MSRQERSGWRDQAYSRWHRSLPYPLDFLDIDWIEFCHECDRIFAVYELCANIDQFDKVATQTTVIAERLGVPGFLVLYEAADSNIHRFRIRRLTAPVTPFKELTPAQWARQLVALRTCHPVQREVPPQPVLPSDDLGVELDAILENVPWPRPEAA